MKKYITFVAVSSLLFCSSCTSFLEETNPNKIPASNFYQTEDEIANLPYHLQAKLLTVIQKRYFIKVGSNTPQPTNIRLICATNRKEPKAQ